MERTRLVTSRYTGKTRDLLRHISEIEPNTAEAISGFVDFRLDTGFTFGGTEFLGSKWGRLIGPRRLCARGVFARGSVGGNSSTTR